MEKRKEGLTMVQVRIETRDLIKRLALNVKQTIPDFLADAMEQHADAVGEEKPEEYKTERKVDQELAKGDFKDRGARKPKVKDEFFLPDTRKEWEKLFAHRWEEFGEWYTKTRSTPDHKVEWPGDENYYNNLSLG